MVAAVPWHRRMDGSSGITSVFADDFVPAFMIAGAIPPLIFACAQAGSRCGFPQVISDCRTPPAPQSHVTAKAA